MIDLHMHTFHSDGVLIPSELAQRAKVKGYQAMAITDHVDQSNLETYVPQIVKTAQALSRQMNMVILGGLEITHVPPAQIPAMIKRSRQLGAEVVVVHGESPVEPVAPGTNRAAILGQADIIAHPGLISMADVKLAMKKKVALELTSRAGHALTNGHVAKLGQQVGCELVVNSDTHAPGDLLSLDRITKIICGAGLPATKAKQFAALARSIIKRARA